MGLLKWFNKDNYATLGEVLSVIRKELQALQPKDSSDIVWNLSEDGLSAQLRSSSVGSQGTSEEGEIVYTPTDEDEYNGMFKLLPVSATQLKLISGSVPEQTDFAGGSDVPGFSKIPQMMLELAPDIRHRIYIYFDYDKAGKEYSVHLGTEIPDGIVLYEYLGEFFNGSVVQSYKKNSYLRFGDIWYLTPEGE